MAQRITPLVLFHDRPLSSNPTTDKDAADSNPSSQPSLSPQEGSRATTTTRSIADSGSGMDIDVDPDLDMQLDPKVSESRDPSRNGSSSNNQQSSASNDHDVSSANADLQVLGTSKPMTASDSTGATTSTDAERTTPGPVDMVQKSDSTIQDEPASTSMAVSPPSSFSSSTSGLMIDTLAMSLSPARVDMHRKRIERMLQQNALMWWELVRYTRTLERKERELEQDREQFRPPGTPMGWGKKKIVHHYHHHHHHHHPSMPPLHPQQQQSLASSSTSTLSSRKFKIKSGRAGGRPFPYEYPMVTNDRPQTTHPLPSPHRQQQQSHQTSPQTPPPLARESEHSRITSDLRADPIIARPVPVKPSTFVNPPLTVPPVSTSAPASSAAAIHPKSLVSNSKPPGSGPPPPMSSDSPSATASAQPEEEDCNHQGGEGDNAHAEDQCPNSGSVDPNRKRRGNLPKSVTAVLKAWLVQNAIHPYPTEDQKQQLSEATNLSLNQISNWFINARRRILQPILVQAAAEAVAGTDAPMDNVLIVRKGKGSRMQVEMEGVVAQAPSSSAGAGSSVGAGSGSSPVANLGSSSTDVKVQQQQRHTPPATGHSTSSHSNSLREERRPATRSPSYREQGYGHSPHPPPISHTHAESPVHHPRTQAEHPGHTYHQHQHPHQHRHHQQPQPYPHQHSQDHYYHERAHQAHQTHQAHLENLEHDHRPYHRQQQQQQQQPHIHAPYPHPHHSHQHPQPPQQHSSQRISPHQRGHQLSPHGHGYYPSQSRTRSPSPSHPPHSSSKVPAPA